MKKRKPLLAAPRTLASSKRRESSWTTVNLETGNRKLLHTFDNCTYQTTLHNIIEESHVRNHLIRNVKIRNTQHLGKRQISGPYRESNHDSSVVQPIA